MTKLHEVLAVEADKEGVAKRISEESIGLFKNNHQAFLGADKKLTMDDSGYESLEKASIESREINTTVPARLAYTAKLIADWFNVVAQKEFTNQSVAKADLVIGDETLASDVPATMLLGLESKLKQVRKIYEVIPTLAPGVVWEVDGVAGDNVFRARDPEIRTKTKKEVKHRVLYEATKEHPAQIEKWNEEVVVGRYKTEFTSGMITSARKAELLGRVDALIQATKQARQRANNVDIASVGNIGGAIFDFINK